MRTEGSAWCSVHHSYVFSNFFAIFWLFLDILPYSDICPGPWKQPQCHHQQWAPSPIFFLIFWLFSSYSTIFGNAPWTLKTDPDVITNSEHHPPFFSDFSPILLLFFIWKKRIFPYLEMRPGPWKQCPTSSPTVSTTTVKQWVKQLPWWNEIKNEVVAVNEWNEMNEIIARNEWNRRQEWMKQNDLSWMKQVPYWMKMHFIHSR